MTSSHRQGGPLAAPDQEDDLSLFGVEAVSAGSLELELERIADEKLHHEVIYGGKRQRELAAKRTSLSAELQKLVDTLADLSNHVNQQNRALAQDLRKSIQVKVRFGFFCLAFFVAIAGKGHIHVFPPLRRCQCSTETPLSFLN
jgi:hypothetical protein